MASSSLKHLIFLACVALVSMGIARASDPDILFDYIVPPNMTEVDGNFFTYTKLRGIFDAPSPPTVKSAPVSITEFPALKGQSVSLSVLHLPPGGISAPHTRTHASGLFFVLKGSVKVGFVDIANKLYTQTLQTGDMFVFPKGLIHYQYNADPKKPAMAIAAFGSASAAGVSVPASVFATNIDNEILAKSFNTDIATIQKLKNCSTGKV